MYDLLRGLRVIEGASFIAAPSGGLYFAQLGAEVIRFDTIGGGPDFNRWPASPQGKSFYWEGLNKGKKSIALNLSKPEGRELAARLVTAPGPGGMFLTNYPVDGFLSHARLAALRADLITIRVMGWPDGAPAMDYMVNSAIGIPFITGPASLDADVPVNHSLPAWDLITGAYAAFALLAAERHRTATGQGQEIRIPLGDVAMATLGHLGQVAEVATTGRDRQRLGNDLFGAFGRDFATKDGRRLMIVAITQRQWKGLLAALSIGEAVASLEAELGVSFANDEILRFEYRQRLFAIVEAALAQRTYAEAAAALDANAAGWGPFRSLKQALAEDPRFSVANPMFADLAHASGYRYPTPGAAMTIEGHERKVPVRAPMLGENTDEVLATVLDLPGHEIAALHDKGIVAGASKTT